MREDEKILRQLEYLTEEIKLLRHDNRRQFDLLQRLIWFLINPNRFTILITQEGNPMAIGSLVFTRHRNSSSGSARQRSAVHSARRQHLRFLPTLTADDTNISIAADPSNPLSFNVNIPAGDPSTVANFTATATAPDGTTATGTLAIPFAAQPQQFSINIQQTA